MAVLSAAVAPARLPWLDVARGTAIVAMVIYHGAFDLAFFGLVDWPVTRAPAWRAFAAAIAATFLFLAGYSLVLAHGGGVRWRAFARRLALIGGAAALVTAATWIAMPAPITFGILHAIATFSVLALPFVFAPPLVTVAAAAFVFVLPQVFRHDIFASPWLVPFGLAPSVPFTFDYEPIFPWLGATLLGVAAARALPVVHGRPIPPLGLLGRHSLAIYLLHQPVLFAILYSVSQLVLR